MYGWRAKIGRISPSPETVGCEEWRRAMPEGVCLVETRTLLHDVTVEGLAETVKQVERAALELASAEVDVILQAGTAIAFFRGFGHDRELSRRISAATGIKATSQDKGCCMTSRHRWHTTSTVASTQPLIRVRWQSS